jgi:hypothetical protein
VQVTRRDCARRSRLSGRNRSGVPSTSRSVACHSLRVSSSLPSGNACPATPGAPALRTAPTAPTSVADAVSVGIRISGMRRVDPVRIRSGLGTRFRRARSRQRGGSISSRRPMPISVSPRTVT